LGQGHTGKNKHNHKGQKMSTNMSICWATVLAVVAITLATPGQVYAEPKTKEVCKDVVGKDGKTVKNKDGTTKQACKTIKVHKKLEGTEVPTKK
jgi:hypothetical protein